jgi:hypothetical protein
MDHPSTCMEQAQPARGQNERAERSSKTGDA